MSAGYTLYKWDGRTPSEIADRLAKVVGASHASPRAPKDIFDLRGQHVRICVYEPDKHTIETQSTCYGFTVNVLISFIKPRGEAVREMMLVINELMKDDTRDFVLEFNGEFPVVLRRDQRVLVNHQFDDGSHFPFDMLTVPYEAVFMDHF